jgi:hypothetical protein
MSCSVHAAVWHRLLTLLAGVGLLVATLPAAFALSPFYEWQTIAKKGDTTNLGETITGFDPEVSVNEKGKVAFVAAFSKGSDVVVGNAVDPLQNLTWSAALGRFTNYDFAMINNQDRVVARDMNNGVMGLMWLDVNAPGQRNVFVGCHISDFSQLTLPVIANELSSARPYFAFLGRVEDLPFEFWINQGGYRNEHSRISSLNGATLSYFRAMMARASSGRIVAAWGDAVRAATDGRVVLFKDEDGIWESVLVASTSNDAYQWLSLGRFPSISENGTYVAFGGSRAGTDAVGAPYARDDAGIYIYVADPIPDSMWGPYPIRIWDQRRMLTYNEAGDPIYFREFEFQNNRVALVHQEYSPPGPEGDCLTFAFVATPTEASRYNPTTAAHRLQFTDKQGIWTLRVKIERELADPRELKFHCAEPIPVIQVGDRLPDDSTVMGLQLYDPLSLAEADAKGVPRRPAFGDHFIAFSATLDRNHDGKVDETRIFRGALLDTDEDGLLDHWEREGIDIDEDLFPEIRLKDMGASVYRKDIFLEIDWLSKRTEGVPSPWTTRLADGVAANLVRMFADAPVANPDGSLGITLHVDAGAEVDGAGLARSINMGSDPRFLDGGQEIEMPGGGGTGSHPDLVYIGLPDEMAYPNLNARDLHRAKDLYFGRKDDRMRELAFRYCVLSEFVSVTYDKFGRVYRNWVSNATATTLTSDLAWFDEVEVNGTKLPNLVGCGVKITAGTGVGQVRLVTANTRTQLTVIPDWGTVPDTTSQFVILAPFTGDQEEFVASNPYLCTRPGNDLIVGLAPYGIQADGQLGTADAQFRIIANLLGRTLGLRPGGNDMTGSKPADEYRSLMNYTHTFDLGGAVTSFAGAGDPTFNDWANLRLAFFHNTRFIGNSFEHGPGGRVPETTPDEIVPPWIDVPEDRPNPRPWVPPVLEPPFSAGVLIRDPDGLCSTGYGLGSTVTVKAQAWDTRMPIRYVQLMFDLDGDGIYSTTEAKIAEYVPASERYEATFSPVSGALGVRKAIAFAFNRDGTRFLSVKPYVAGGVPSDAQTLLNQTGSFAAQSAARDAKGARQKADFNGLSLPGSGLLVITVTSTPPIPVTAAQARREDANVAKIRCNGSDVLLSPLGTPATTSPAMYTSTWQVPVGGGTLAVELLGPGAFDGAGVFLGHPVQGYTILVRFLPRDNTPPTVAVTAPGAGGFVGLTQDLVVEATVTDDYGVTGVQMEFDRSGDSDTSDASERVAATALGSGRYRATFAAVSGAAETRQIRVTGSDAAGHDTLATTFVEVRAPDTTPPSVTILSPAAAATFRFSDTITVDVQAGDDARLDTLAVAFDLNGDGDTTDAGEALAGTLTGPGSYRVTYAGCSGPAGARVITATATDSSRNPATNSVPITIAGAIFAEETLFHLSGTFPAGGGRQSLNWGPVTVPYTGILRFVVSGTPPWRSPTQNLPREDSRCTQITFAGTTLNLAPQWSTWGVSPSVCTATYEATASGSLSGKLESPMTWDIWGDPAGYPLQNYVLDVYFLRVDKVRPTIAITSPARGANVAVGASLVVDIAASDEVQLASIMATFDVDGDGSTNGPGENLVASLVSPGNYRATFAGIGGTAGPRRLEAVATDAALNKRSVWTTYGVDGAGTGESLLDSRSGTIPAQGWGATRVVTPYGPITIPRSGRLVFRVISTPNVRQAVANLDRYDSMVQKITFNGQNLTLAPVGNAMGSNPAILESTWDAPAAGTLTYELLGPAVYNIWGEFDGQGGQAYTIEVLFIPGPAVTQLLPNSGTVGGGDSVRVLGSGFGVNAVVLFGEVPGRDVTRVSGTELTCKTPPGAGGAVTVRVLNNDAAGQPWNYGRPYSLFGDLTGGFTYQPFAAITRNNETLVTTAKGFFDRVGYDQAQRWQDTSFTVPAGGGWLHFVAYAFVPILNAIPGPFEDPTNLWWHNESSRVSSFVGSSGARYGLGVTSTDLNFPFGPVICEARTRVGVGEAGSGSLRVTGPAQWNAFYRQFGEYVMEGAPAQTWSAAVWFSSTDATLTQPAGGVTWFSGTSQSITWTSTGTDTACTLHYSIDGGRRWSRIASLGNLSARAYTWAVPGVDLSRSDCYVKLVWATGEAIGPRFTLAPNQGALTVNLAPPAALTGGARWQLDGGGLWHLSGDTVTGLVPGSHTLTFSPVFGYLTPAARSITISAGQTRTESETYNPVPTTGALTVTLTPAGAVTAGARWRVDGGAWQSSGATVSGLSPGSHAVSFGSAAGYYTPAERTVAITVGLTSPLSQDYTPLPTTGALTVDLAPTEAVSAGAQWRVDSGAWQASGATVSGLAPGNHAVSFKAATGYVTPADRTAAITVGLTSTLSQTYTLLPTTGGLTVTLGPAAALVAGAQWRVDGGAWQASGATVSELAAGSHTVSFKAATGYVTPADRDVLITAGLTATLPVDYLVAAPANDNFADRVAIIAPTLSVTGTNLGATKQSGEPDHAGRTGGKSVWWTWTALATGAAEIHTVGSAFDTLLAVYAGAAVDALTLVAANDDYGSGSTSRVSFAAVSGTAYQIAVDGYSGATGSIVLTVVPPAAPTTGALTVTLSPAGAIAAGAQWRVDGGAWQASGATVSGLTPGNHTVSFKAVAGYATPADRSAAITAGETTTLPVSYAGTGPANDNFADRIPITAPALSVTGTNLGASKQAGEPDHVGLAGGASVWWIWTATASGGAEINTAGSSFDTLLAVYTGAAVDALTLVAANDDYADRTSRVAFAATAGTAYQIAVDGYGAATGSVTLTVVPPAAPTTGALTVTLSPAGATAAGAQWRVDAGAWQDSGATVSGLTVGSHTLSFKATAGYATPADRSVTITAGVTTTLSVTYAVAGLTNDDFADRIPVMAPFLSVTGTNLGATKQAGEPDHAGRTGGASVWWTWTATASGTTEINTLGTSFDTLLAVYTGTAVGALTLVAENDDSSGYQSRVTFAATVGVAYQIAVDGYGAATGSISLTVIPGAVVPTGSLTVTLGPAGAVAAGAQWRVDGGVWQDSGASVSGLTPGTHTVSCKAVTGWVTPANLTVTVVAAATATANRTYAAAGALAFLDAPLTSRTLSAGALASLRLDIVNELGGTLSVTRISGSLPPGLSQTVNPAAAELVLSGIPTKVGTYTVVLEARTTVGGTTVVGGRITVDLAVKTVAEINPQGVGSFVGTLFAAGTPAVRGTVTLTASTAGKLLVKLTLRTKAYSYSLATWSRVDADGTLWAAFTKAGTVESLAFSVSPAGSGTGTFTASEGIFDLAMERVPWNRTTRPASEYVGYYTVSLPVDTGVKDLTPPAALAPKTSYVPYGGGYLVLSVAADGKATYSGKLADGTRFSGSTVLVEAGAATAAERGLITVFVPLYSKGGSLSGRLEVVPWTARVEGLAAVSGCTPTALFAWSYPGLKPAQGWTADAFAMTLAPCGAAYVKGARLESLGIAAASLVTGEAPADAALAYKVNSVTRYAYPALAAFPEELPISVGSGKLTAPPPTSPVRQANGSYTYHGSNDSGLKLAYSTATGVFSGSFKLYYDYWTTSWQHKAVTVAFEGVLTPDSASNCAAEPLPLGHGYFLVPDNNAAAGYTFKRSYPIWLLDASGR